MYFKMLINPASWPGRAIHACMCIASCANMCPVQMAYQQAQDGIERRTWLPIGLYIQTLVTELWPLRSTKPKCPSPLATFHGPYQCERGMRHQALHGGSGIACTYTAKATSVSTNCRSPLPSSIISRLTPTQAALTPRHRAAALKVSSCYLSVHSFAVADGRCPQAAARMGTV